MNSILHFLASSIHQSPSADNYQPWLIKWDEKTLTVTYDSGRVKDQTFPPENPATLLTIGATLENIKQAATAIGLELNLQIPQELDLSELIYYHADINTPHKEISLSKKSIPLFNRHTNRLAYKKSPLSPDIIKMLSDQEQGPARVVIFEHKNEIQEIAQVVKKASEIRFQTEEVHEWLGKSLRFSDEGGSNGKTGDGLDTRTLDLPPGGQLFLHLIKSWSRMKLLNKIGAYKLLSIIDSAPIQQAPCLVAIIGPTKFQDILAAGQLMTRVWIELNNHGIAAHPYFVISDQLHRREANLIPDELTELADSIHQSSQKIFHLKEGETIQMLLRVGYPKKIPIPSKRLKLNKVCTGFEIKEN